MLLLGVVGVLIFVGGSIHAFTHKQRAPIPQRTLEEIAKAERGDVKAQYGLALCYAVGLEGLVKDPAEATKWYLKAAGQNFALAQFHLAECYQQGLGVATNNMEAAKWYRKAAEQNHAEAQFQLGLIYNNGKGVLRDDTEAVKWWRKAAEQNHIFGQSCLASSYAYGRGVAQDYVEAYAWCNLYSNRVVGAASTMNPMAAKMSAQQIADALKRSEDLRAQIEAKPGCD